MSSYRRATTATAAPNGYHQPVFSAGGGVFIGSGAGSGQIRQHLVEMYQQQRQHSVDPVAATSGSGSAPAGAGSASARHPPGPMSRQASQQHLSYGGGGGRRGDHRRHQMGGQYMSFDAGNDHEDSYGYDGGGGGGNAGNFYWTARVGQL